MANEPPPAAETQTPSLRLDNAHQNTPALHAMGSWTLPLLAPRIAEIRKVLVGPEQQSFAWDLLQLTGLDSGGALLLWQSWGEKRPESLQMRPEHEALFAALAKSPAPATAPHQARVPAVMRLGSAALAGTSHLTEATRLGGQLAIDLTGWVRRPQSIAWREISANVYRSGAQALPITALVGFLVGVTLSYLIAQQLRSFGADTFVVNILGIGVWRELGPLLAAIIIAGRSGSSMTAQLGVMRVTQELDALSVMGISHTARLVLPKVLGLAVAMPLVTVWTSLVMLAGGMVVAKFQLGIDYVQFMKSLPSAVPIANLFLGLSKSILFGALIALVACHYGLLIKPNTESLGAGTTSSVVSSITAVIVVDAVIAIMFNDVGLY